MDLVATEASLADAHLLAILLRRVETETKHSAATQGLQEDRETLGLTLEMQPLARLLEVQM